MNPEIEAFVAAQMVLFWGYINANDIVATAENAEQVVNDLIEELRRIAMDAYLACKARETALSLYAGFPVDLGCVAP